MGFRLSESFKQKQKEIYEKQYVLFGDKEVHVSEIENRSLSTEMLKDARMNSYATDKIFPKLTNEALINKAELYRSNCERYRYPATTYDQSLIHLIVPELIERIKELEAKK